MTEKTTKKEKLVVKVDPELHAEIDAERARLKLFMYDVVDLAWQAYKAARDKTTPREEKIPPQLRKYMDMLADILASEEASEEPSIIDGVTRNLDLFYELLQRRTRKRD